MNVFRLFLFPLVLLCLTLNSWSQDKIQLMNGKVLRGKVTKEFDDYYNFQYYKKGGKTKALDISKYRVFSLTDSKGAESILYHQDTLMGNFMTQNEMKMFVYGQRDAHNNFKATPLFVLGFGVGFTSVVLDTYEFQAGNSNPQGFFNRTPSVTPILVPFVFTLGGGLIKTKVRKEYASDVTFLSSEYYIEGFQKITKAKKLKSSFLGSVAGVAAGFLVYNLAK